MLGTCATNDATGSGVLISVRHICPIGDADIFGNTDRKLFLGSYALYCQLPSLSAVLATSGPD